jgi:thiamine biosynthesis lipoprotein
MRVTADYTALAVSLEPPMLRKSSAMYLDLSPITKGFGVDKIAEVLTGRRIISYVATIDGEVRISGRKPDGSAWSFGIDFPVAGSQEIWDVWEPRDCALATSGDYRHFRALEDRVVSHAIDARTGQPVHNEIASVKVCSPSCMVADAWATALMVLGPKNGVTVAQARNIPAIFLFREGSRLVSVTTGDMESQLGI